MPEALNPKRVKPIIGGILSGGLSTRMGQAKDRIILPDGRPMLQHVLDVLLNVCNEVIVAGPELPLDLKENERVHFVKDNFGGLGPLGGIEAILSSGLARGYLIAGCDQPLLREEVLRWLIPEDRDMPCFYDSWENGVMQPLPGYYPVSWLADIRDALRRNRRALKALIADSDVVLKPIDAASKICLRSINTQDELKAYIANPVEFASIEQPNSKHAKDQKGRSGQDARAPGEKQKDQKPRNFGDCCDGRHNH